MYDELLIHVCEIRRRGQQRDRFNQPVEPGPNSPLAWSGPCRLSSPRGSEKFQERARDVVGEQFTLFLPIDADVLEADRVIVKDGEGRLLVELGNVTYVKTPSGAGGYHHREAALSVQRSSGDARPS